MSPPATGFLVYLWHYLLARLLYEELLRPLAGGSGAVLLILLGAVGLVLLAPAIRKRRRG